MDKPFRLSLLYLMLIIPEHGNSPVPRMESWVEMDQGDGFVDRDLTSSLTGAESFGSAHKNYQNALIRKPANIEDESLHDVPIDELSGKIPDRVLREADGTPNFVQNEYGNYGDDNFVAGSAPDQQICQETNNGMDGYQDERCRIQPSSSNGRTSNSRFYNRFYGSNLADLMNPPLTGIEATSFQEESENPQEEVTAVGVGSPSAKFSLGEDEKFGTDCATSDVLSNREGADEIEYAIGSEDFPKRLKSESNDDYLMDTVMGDGLERNRDLLRYNRDEEEDVSEDEGDYYGDIRNPAPARDYSPDNMDVEYGEMRPNRIIYKRDETKTRVDKTKTDGEEVSSGPLAVDDKENLMKGPRGSKLLRAEAPKEGHEITKDVSNGKFHASNLVWSMNSNGESEALRHSRGVPQGKSGLKSSNNYGRKKKGALEEKRNKREDEDEQKNMKTGTDEGGGEYEDEEGKGHNDEEEYYEEGEISGDNPFSGPYSGRHLHKRETPEDEEEKGNKDQEKNEDVSLEEYAINLENAPVEHEDNSKKCSWHEGKNREKSVTRRGMKIWDEWGKWSPCSVTCGVGRKTRWRHCVGGGCARGEKEALIKKCTYPAC